MMVKSTTEFHFTKSEIINFLNEKGYQVNENEITNIRYNNQKDYLTIVCSVDLDSEINPANVTEGIENELLDLKVEELDISVKTLSLLKNADLNTIRSIFERGGVSFLRKIYGFGHISMLNLKHALYTKGINLNE